MDLEEMKSSELLDIAAKINVMQKGFHDFCACAFSEIDDLDTKYGGKDGESSVEDLDKRIAIRRSCMSISNKFRLKIKAEVEKSTGRELEIDPTDTIYDSVMTSNMSKIVEDIISIVQKRNQMEGTQK